LPAKPFSEPHRKPQMHHEWHHEHYQGTDVARGPSVASTNGLREPAGRCSFRSVGQGTRNVRGRHSRTPAIRLSGRFSLRTIRKPDPPNLQISRPPLHTRRGPGQRIFPCPPTPRSVLSLG
jgi:hypothetical protein